MLLFGTMFGFFSVSFLHFLSYFTVLLGKAKAPLITLCYENTTSIKIVSASPGFRDLLDNIKSAVAVYLCFSEALDLVTPDLLIKPV